jgi:hypothetical protein
MSKYREYTYRERDPIKILKEFNEAMLKDGAYIDVNKIKKENTIVEKRKFKFVYASSHKWDFGPYILFFDEKYIGMLEPPTIKNLFIGSDSLSKEELASWAIFIYPYKKGAVIPESLQTIIYFKYRNDFKSPNRLAKKVDKIMKKFEKNKFNDKIEQEKIGDKTIPKIFVN